VFGLSALSPEDFERFRCFYSECWDPPDTPPPDLSFLDDGAPLVPLLPNAVEHDITGPCDETELLKALSTLHLGKAPGPSQVTVRICTRLLRPIPTFPSFFYQSSINVWKATAPKS
jgi:hypothetical protein